MITIIGKIRNISLLLLLLTLSSISLYAQSSATIKGKVVDSDGVTVVGATVIALQNQTIGTITDNNGEFSLELPKGSVIEVSFVGMQSKQLAVTGQSKTLIITLEVDSAQLEEVIVVGYGQQKKASVVGAISQTTGEVLKRASSGLSDVGSALTGNLPGVVTSASTGMPGEEEPEITIRSASSWNNSSPLVLVDGIERPMSSVDVGSIEYISVLKDASATAVYGVKGANGVILITTKRGEAGRAVIDVSANATMKSPSYLPTKYDSYDALMARNVAIENELGLSSDSWDYITPQGIIEKYRNPLSLEEAERYPNIDWQDELFKDFAMSYNTNVNVSGGNKVVKYFASIDYAHEGDIFKSFDNSRGYQSQYGYDRINVRSNLDFQITPTTVFKMNLAGSNAIKSSPWANSGSTSGDPEWEMAQQWSGIYGLAPDAFLPQYSDGTWGYYPNDSNIRNSVATFALGGLMKSTTTRLSTDFVLQQDLGFLLKGLSAQASVSWDNVFVESQRGINDMNNSAQYKWIDPSTGEVTYSESYDVSTGFDFMPGSVWTTQAGTIEDWNTQAQLNYQTQVNWARDYDEHSVTAMGLFSRQQYSWGSEIPSNREDWAFRTTYSYKDRYFAEYNGAYNGSDKFSAENRFAFFNSGAVGWMISEEKFMKSLKFLDMLKLRASYGEIGDDSINERWLYLDQWAYGGTDGVINSTPMPPYDQSGVTGTSPYTWYRESVVGNPDVHWETVTKVNLGLDYSFLGGLLAGTAEFFQDNRRDILISGSDIALSSYYGATAPTANLGRVRTQGYELQLRVNKVFNNGVRAWSNLSATRAINTILEKSDPELYPDYQKDAGFAMGQTTSYVESGFVNSYDELYGSTSYATSDSERLPGDYLIIDYNADGVIDANDVVPYGYSSTPENTYNASLGVEWKGFSLYVQFYGVTNVSRTVYLSSFASNTNNVYDLGTWWSGSTSDGEVLVPRWNTTDSNSGTQYIFDGSYLRLKNAEIAYTFSNDAIQKLGFKSLRVYVNGNNIWVWSKMPDDRESNFAGGDAQFGSYPTMRRFNLGVNFTL
ncbi:MAG: TonB-dependent receptor [Rikenellaceae bacterium]